MSEAQAHISISLWELDSARPGACQVCSSIIGSSTKSNEAWNAAAEEGSKMI